MTNPGSARGAFPGSMVGRAESRDKMCAAEAEVGFDVRFNIGARRAARCFGSKGEMSKSTGAKCGLALMFRL